MADTPLMNYYWNHEHPLRPYTHALRANPNSKPPLNASRTPPAPAPEGKYPAWTGGGWGLIEDHRGKTGYVGKERIEIKDWGPLPAGWSADPPPPTAAEQRQADMAECMAKLDELDRKSTRSLRAIEALRRKVEAATGEAKTALEVKLAKEEAFLAGLEDKAQVERAKLTALNAAEAAAAAAA